MGTQFIDSSLPCKINENGFRRWYEYELARSFGYLALGLLALILGLIAIEGVFHFKGDADRWIQLIVSFAAICMTGWTWLQFIRILLNAESVSRQAICRSCKKYGQFTAVEDVPTSDPEERLVSVKCKHCQNIWRMAYTVQSSDERF